jgi:hypothetical protein
MAIVAFEPDLDTLLPETHTILVAANVTLHPRVTRMVLHGSRGLARNWRANSDIDLTLIVEKPTWHSNDELDKAMREVLAMTRDAWRGVVEADLAVVFDMRDCGLACFNAHEWRTNLCSVGGQDCFGLYKEQRGYSGLVWNAGVQVRRMYPCLVVWRRPLSHQHGHALKRVSNQVSPHCK